MNGKTLSLKPAVNGISFSKHGAAIIFILLMILNGIFTPNFASLGMLRNLLLQVFPIMIVSMGMTIVISSGGIDISVGSIMAVAAAALAKNLGIGIFPAIVIGLSIGVVFGAFNGFLIAKFKIQPMIVTLILMVGGRGIAQQLNNGYVISFYDHPFVELGLYSISGIPIQVFVMLLVIASVFILMYYMVLGKYIQAIGDNLRASELSGIKTFKITIIIYALSAFFASLAAIFETSRICSADPNTLGRFMELDAIAAVAVGGTSMTGGKANVIGTVFGALIIQLITISVNMNNINYYYSLILKAVIIIAAMYLQQFRTKGTK
ncbi:MAG: hypothetical protein B6241_06770 [Spirochaetaceae bacterium 4572_59]|nr:MAG: hypothetical protein B6241_06770 [Spirochaetaceae bacterium 4572_59]